MEECGGVHIHFLWRARAATLVIPGARPDVEKARKQLLHLAEEKVSAVGGGLCSHPRWRPCTACLCGRLEHICAQRVSPEGLSRPDTCMFSGEN